MRFSTSFTTAALLLLLAGCNEAAQSTPTNESVANDPVSQPVKVEASKEAVVIPSADSQKGINMTQGTVRYINLEGGFWGIETDDGQQILPQGLNKEYQQDGLRISFKAKEITDMMTIQQWGVFSQLSDITIIGKVDSKSTNPNI